MSEEEFDPDALMMEEEEQERMQAVEDEREQDGKPMMEPADSSEQKTNDTVSVSEGNTWAKSPPTDDAPPTQPTLAPRNTTQQRQPASMRPSSAARALPSTGTAAAHNRSASAAVATVNSHHTSNRPASASRHQQKVQQAKAFNRGGENRPRRSRPSSSSAAAAGRARVAAATSVHSAASSPNPATPISPQVTHSTNNRTTASVTYNTTNININTNSASAVHDNHLASSAPTPTQHHLPTSLREYMNPQLVPAALMPPVHTSPPSSTLSSLSYPSSSSSSAASALMSSFNTSALQSVHQLASTFGSLGSMITNQDANMTQQIDEIRQELSESQFALSQDLASERKDRLHRFEMQERTNRELEMRIQQLNTRMIIALSGQNTFIEHRIPPTTVPMAKFAVDSDSKIHSADSMRTIDSVPIDGVGQGDAGESTSPSTSTIHNTLLSQLLLRVSSLESALAASLRREQQNQSMLQEYFDRAHQRERRRVNSAKKHRTASSHRSDTFADDEGDNTDSTPPPKLIPVESERPQSGPDAAFTLMHGGMLDGVAPQPNGDNQPARPSKHEGIPHLHGAVRSSAVSGLDIPVPPPSLPSASKQNSTWPSSPPSSIKPPSSLTHSMKVEATSTTASPLAVTAIEQEKLDAAVTLAVSKALAALCRPRGGESDGAGAENDKDTPTNGDKPDPSSTSASKATTSSTAAGASLTNNPLLSAESLAISAAASVAHLAAKQAQDAMDAVHRLRAQHEAEKERERELERKKKEAERLRQEQEEKERENEEHPPNDGTNRTPTIPFSHLPKRLLDRLRNLEVSNVALQSSLDSIQNQLSDLRSMVHASSQQSHQSLGELNREYNDIVKRFTQLAKQFQLQHRVLDTRITNVSNETECNFNEFAEKMSTLNKSLSSKAEISVVHTKVSRSDLVQQLATFRNTVLSINNKDEIVRRDEFRANLDALTSTMQESNHERDEKLRQLVQQLASVLDQLDNKADKQDLLALTRVLTSMPQVDLEVDRVQRQLVQLIEQQTSRVKETSIDRKQLGRAMTKLLKSLQQEIAAAATGSGSGTAGSDDGGAQSTCTACATREGIVSGAACLSCSTRLKLFSKLNALAQSSNGGGGGGLNESNLGHEILASRGGGFVVTAAQVASQVAAHQQHQQQQQQQQQQHQQHRQQQQQTYPSTPLRPSTSGAADHYATPSPPRTAPMLRPATSSSQGQTCTPTPRRMLLAHIHSPAPFSGQEVSMPRPLTSASGSVTARGRLMTTPRNAAAAANATNNNSTMKRTRTPSTTTSTNIMTIDRPSSMEGALSSIPPSSSTAPTPIANERFPSIISPSSTVTEPIYGRGNDAPSHHVSLPSTPATAADGRHVSTSEHSSLGSTQLIPHHSSSFPPPPTGLPPYAQLGTDGRVYSGRGVRTHRAIAVNQDAKKREMVQEAIDASMGNSHHAHNASREEKESAANKAPLSARTPRRS